MATLAEEYRAAIDGAAMFDVSDRALIEVTGRDRVAFLHNFCTNDIKRLQPGDGCEAFVTNVKGRILGHILVFAEPDSLWIHSDPGTQTVLIDHLESFLITEDVHIRDATLAVPQTLVCGTEASRVMEQGLGVNVTGVAMAAHAETIVTTDIRVRRVPWIVGTAFLIMVPDGLASALQENLEDAGCVPAAPDILDVLRIEAMWPRYGVDMTDDHLAQEAGRTVQAISFTKGCYLGQEPIARLDALGHTNRELRGIRCDAPGKVSPGAVVVDVLGAAEVGRISSAVVSPATNCPVALAMLKTVANKPGTAVRLRTEDGAEVGGVVFGPPAIA
jgi:folate-binding protein YgfZ